MFYIRKLSLFVVLFFYTNVFCQLVSYGDCKDSGCVGESGDYQVSGQKWEKSELKYYFKNGTTDIAGDQEKLAFLYAFEKWAEVVPFDFVETFTEIDADIRIVYMNNSQFFSLFNDNEVGYIAASYQPETNCSGLLALSDQAQTFSLLENPENGIDLYYVALHEMGHILGLCHAANSETLMATYSGTSKRSLHAYDIEGMRSIYSTVKIKNKFLNPGGSFSSGGIINAEVIPEDFRDFNTTTLPNNEKLFAFDKETERRFEAKEQIINDVDRKFNSSILNNGGWIFNQTLVGTQSVLTTVPTDGLYEANYKFKTDVSLNALTEFDNTINLGVVSNIYQYESEDIEALDPYTPNIITYNFAGWSDDLLASNPRYVTPIENESYTALYKYPNHSNNSTTFSNSSQQKAVKTSDGKIHMVYESMGKVWYERSTDNGSTWVLMNGGKPLSNNDSKHPAIDEYSNMITIVWQEKSGSGWGLKAVVFSGTSKRAESTFATGSSWSLDTTPSIAWGYNGKAVIAYRDYNYFGSLSICYRVGSFSYYGINWYGSEGYISNSSTTSYNPTIAALDSSSWPIKFHVAWETVFSSTRHIEYQRIDISSDGTSNMNSNNYKEISSYYYANHYGPYSTNEHPSIDVNYSNGEVQVVWVGRGSYSKVMKRTMNYYGWSNSFSYFDDYYVLYSPTVKYARDGDYVIGWGRSNGSYAKYWNSSSQSISSTNKIGRDIQLVKQTNSTQVKGVVFNSSTTPYNFSTTSNVLSKNSSEETNRFREAVIVRNGFSYIFNFGNVRLDNEPIEFKPLVDSLNLSSKEILAEYIMTEPFVFDNNSDLTFSIFSEIVGDQKTSFKSKENVEFLVELIDSDTKNILGLYKKAEYSEIQKDKLEQHSFRIKGKGIGSKKVQLRVRTEDNVGEGYFFSEIYILGDSTLSKRTEIETNFQGLLAVDDYVLSQNYPNPFNPQTTINYQLPKDGLVTLKIYDVLGKEVTELVNGYKGAGSYNVTFDGSNLASGIYFYKITAGDFTNTKKFMLMK